VIGTAKQRVPDTVNKNIATGEVELIAEELRILNESKQPPFLPSETVLPNEEMRLKYRYIDLRRDAMQQNIELRHKVALAIRDYLSSQGFFEIETPFMTRSTPEGARDYLVPSRVQPGSFYARPQSAHLLKQTLMISGSTGIFRSCYFRDRRAPAAPGTDRSGDVVSQAEQVWEVVEVSDGSVKAAGSEIKTPFPRMTYDETMRLYAGKPDMRLPALVDVRSIHSRGTGEFREHSKLTRALPLCSFEFKAGEMSGAGDALSELTEPSRTRKTASVRMISFRIPEEDIPSRSWRFASGSRSRRSVVACRAQGRLQTDSQPVLPDLRAAPARSYSKIRGQAWSFYQDRQSGKRLSLSLGD
jgi:aspartyl-tRNA synthetase